MGACLSSSSGEEQIEAERAAEIERQLQIDGEKFYSELNVLLLGAGESGKSTILKQMRILYMQGFSDDDRRRWRSVVHLNMLESMKRLIAGVRILPAASVHFAPEEEKMAKMVLDAVTTRHDPTSVFMSVKSDLGQLWSSQAIRHAMEHTARLQIPDSTAYYYTDLARISQPAFVPTDQDILRSREATTAVVEMKIELDGHNLNVIDVGGQRNQRSKWLSHFESCTAVIFVVGMSEYDQVLVEDEKTNRMKEALSVWEGICNHRYFAHTAMLLFLNKMDLFEEKLKRVPLSVCFQDYALSDEVEPASHYIREQFMTKNTQEKEIYSHFTCATDTSNVRVVLDVCKSIILQGALDDMGI